MASVPVPITVDGDTYTVPGADTIEPLAVSVAFDGTNAGGDFLPCLSYYTQAGQLISRTFPASAVTAGSSAEVSFIPFVPPASSVAAGSGGVLVEELVFAQSAGSGFKTTTIVSVNQVTHTFTIAGSHASFFTPGNSVFVIDSGTGHNDGTYTVDTVAVVAGNTAVKVLEAIPSTFVGGRIITGAYNYAVTWQIPAGAWIVDVLVFEYASWAGTAANVMIVSDEDFPILYPGVGPFPQTATWYDFVTPSPSSTVGGGNAIALGAGVGEVGQVADQENGWVDQGAGTSKAAGKAYPLGGTLTGLVVDANVANVVTPSGDWRARVLYLLPSSSAVAVRQ